ncbi:MAG: CHAT domain-containing protein [Bacteroidota bacterium]
MSSPRAIILSVLFLPLTSYSQQAENREREFLKIYETQLATSLSVRSLSQPEIEKFLANAKGSLATVEDFALELKKQYPAAIAPQIAVLFYFFSNDTLHRYFITPGRVIESSQFAMTQSAVEKLNADVYAAMRLSDLTAKRAPQLRGLHPDPPPKTTLTFDQALQNAAHILLPTTFDERFKHLIVVPAFTIGAFPFQLLRAYSDGSMLIDKCSITIAPSLMDLVAVRKRVLKKLVNGSVERMPATVSYTLENSLFIANPKYPQNTEYYYPDLPGAEKEVSASIPFAKKYKVLKGAAATKDSVIRYIRNADLVYFATHGISAQENPLDRNFLVLSGKDPYLTSRNIVALRDSTGKGDLTFPDMVVLSACQTGLGRSMESGITAGLSRAFLIAGANQVIMSLWSVDDEATAYLMSRFIYHLQQPHAFSPAEPLRLAELDTRAKWKDPHKWASFSVQGVIY